MSLTKSFSPIEMNRFISVFCQFKFFVALKQYPTLFASTWNGPFYTFGGHSENGALHWPHPILNMTTKQGRININTILTLSPHSFPVERWPQEARSKHGPLPSPPLLHPCARSPDQPLLQGVQILRHLGADKQYVWTPKHDGGVWSAPRKVPDGRRHVPRAAGHERSRRNDLRNAKRSLFRLCGMDTK